MRLSLLLALSLATTATANPRLEAMRAKLAGRSGAEVAWAGPDEPNRLRIPQACADLVRATGALKTRALEGDRPFWLFGPVAATTLPCADAAAWDRAVARMGTDWTFVEARDGRAYRRELERFANPTVDGFFQDPQRYELYTGFTEADREWRCYRVGCRGEARRSNPLGYAFRWGLDHCSAGSDTQRFLKAGGDYYDDATLHGGPFVKTALRFGDTDGAYFGQVRDGAPEGFGWVVVPGRFAYAGFLVGGFPQGWGVRLSLLPHEGKPKVHLWHGRFERGFLSKGAETFRGTQPGVTGQVGTWIYTGEMQDGRWEGEGELTVHFGLLSRQRKLVRQAGKFVAGQLVEGTRTYNVNSSSTEVAVAGGAETGESRTRTPVSDLKADALVEVDGQVLAVVEPLPREGTWGAALLSNGLLLRGAWGYKVPVVERGRAGAAEALASAAAQRATLLETRKAASEAWLREQRRGKPLWKLSTAPIYKEQSRPSNWSAYETRVRNGADLGWYNENIQY